MVELSPGASLAAEQVIEERGVEVGVVGDEKNGPISCRAAVEGDEPLDGVSRREGSLLAPLLGVERVHRPRSLRRALRMVGLEAEEEPVDLASFET
jgi:hypothetical protein